ncbi:2-keto-4-pentenoate hydratase/2-oxohepta-3-ene-1,7-dioic acid hydratase (catechol pathway) [Rathayibacter oskolensis]|uniref:2-keto-4-pentenoate hydratase/2-oxohepta-3-ene-1,7-dioic acid hydratase (Catechol pathway) n=1 Tax=Rathayibacter oskolensis TaxID=1891671 RepID=A0A1X7NVZ2_9MICO|nr:fumarylacetoacetate hydrolase family protein [Rathayibacter oskolensis]SMH42446.1 2-keto-4-pentenoate hydratase/2-oxohepta-3-ene-1,7-dioic acid hydratase (catechol pathway) [Rathayibacter oskolensis]
MRLARWSLADGSAGEGLVVDDHVVSFVDGLTVLDVVRGGLAEALRRGDSLVAGPRSALDSVRLRTPLDPPSIRDFVAFEEHVEGVVRSVDSSEGVVPEWYEAPTFYFTNPHTLLATGEELVPPASERLDFELEVAAVIGGTGPSRSLDASAAHERIFGYAVFNDWSARDVQAREMKVRLGPCKGKDFGSTLGPWLTTADEVADRHDPEGFLDLAMTVTVNGVEIGRDTLADMGWPFAELVAYASRDSRLVAGDVLGSGTAGTGCLAELWGRAGSLTPPPLTLGDEVTMTVERLGAITTVVGAPQPVPLVPRARRRPGSPAAQARTAH